MFVSVCESLSVCVCVSVAVSHSHIRYVPRCIHKLFALAAWQQIEIYVRKVCAKSCATSANCKCVCMRVCVCESVCGLVTTVVWGIW